jgi:UDP-N-acetylmuramoyl-tripeptide--D-alanyl-D-alanine ligase
MASQHGTIAAPPPWLAEPGMGLRLGEAAMVLGGLLHATIGAADLAGERICNDSRLLHSGDVFIALADRRDGHLFAADAVARGARFIIVSQWPLPLELRPDQGALIVRDTNAALVRLAQWWRTRHDIITIGVGGGVGKTTTKEAVAALIALRYSERDVLKTPANWNDLRGVSLTLLGLRAHHRRAVIEMGMDRPGEVAQLANLAQPRWGIVTAVSATHLEFFPSMAELVATERGMVENLPGDGLALLNDDDRLVRGMIPLATAPVFTFGTLPGADLRAIRISSRGAEGLHFVARRSAEAISVATHLLGRHLVTSALAAMSVALADGWSLSEAADGLAAIALPQRIALRAGRNASIIIDDTYNASPESMLAALNLLADWPREQGGRRLALLGTMRELGPRSQREHHRLGRRAASRCQALWVTGEEREAIAAGARAGGLDDVRVFADPAESAADLAASLRHHDVALVKASHAVGLDRVVPLLLDSSSSRMESGLGD